MFRHGTHVVKGYRTQDGAGVSLVRVLGAETAEAFDPFLMLDSFDSTDPDAYTAGFPLHPHRGIETVTYLAEGAIQHRDTMGFSDTIDAGEVQWMCAGSGIEHEEQIPPAKRLLGIQLWLNLPKKDKMAHPFYHAIHTGDIEEVHPAEGVTLRLLAGSYEDPAGTQHKGFEGQHLPLDFYEIALEPGTKLNVPVNEDASVMAFTLEGSATIGGLPLGAKTAIKLEEGDRVKIEADPDAPSHVLFLSSVALHEPIAWGGPIVMNTEEELLAAFREIEQGTFQKEQLEH
ncbi:MAG: pirin family protein [Atopobiaceae bacterium]|nr:pirin family protein [Atopobiaceae bacterium]